jgi:hypothetical protein
MTYQERWLLAVATSQPYPQFYATGLIIVPGEVPPSNQPTYSLAEVMAQRDTGALDLSGWTSWRPWALVGGIAAAGAVIGGLIGGGKGAAIGAGVLGVGTVAVLASGALMAGGKS